MSLIYEAFKWTIVLMVAVAIVNDATSRIIRKIEDTSQELKAKVLETRISDLTRTPKEEKYYAY